MVWYLTPNGIYELLNDLEFIYGILINVQTQVFLCRVMEQEEATAVGNKMVVRQHS